jgi:oxalate decarboxylase/phosphoglucose isomerase-like protein (cupin superfamily)
LLELKSTVFWCLCFVYFRTFSKTLDIISADNPNIEGVMEMENSTYKRFVCVDDVEAQVFPWGSLEWLSEPRVTGSSNMVSGIVTLQPGMGHERHNHEGCEEILFVIEGEGSQTVEADGKIMEQVVMQGDLISIPASAYHSTINIGKTPMKIFAVYQFSGPEIYLRNLPDCKIRPAKNAK